VHRTITLSAQRDENLARFLTLLVNLSSAAPPDWDHDGVRSVVGRLGAGVAIVGLVLLVTGTFLPWLRSGSVLRDSYQSIGALRDLIPGSTGLVDALVAGWVAVIPCCAVCVAVHALGLRRTAAVLLSVVSITVGTVAGVVTVQGGGSGSLVGVAGPGPVVTLVGATFALIGAITVVTCPRGGHLRAAGNMRTVGGSP
jgi:hypothetical protein